ncbi:alkyl/aryl-sulfatase [Mumia qirimensis]|uniref:alkyl/aryl-sulfatase n=1 Tax=Mumia qirimensis TaxID=3234852 RepID=UPI00351CD017
MAYIPKDATPSTVAAHRDATTAYDLDDRQDFVDARRGLIAPIDNSAYAYLADDAPCPHTVNPSLWRQSQVLHTGGLYEVVEGLYQVRNSEIANLTVVDGEDGLVIIDTMTSVEASRQALDLFREHVNDKPVVAVIYTHTHVDHYGGVKGIVDPADVAAGKVAIIAPGYEFEKHAIGENIIVGNAMSRRASYAFGSLLEPGARQTVTCGIGIGPGGPGRTVSYLPPTDLVTRTGERRELAGLEFEFLYAPDTEAPEEMHIWIPELKALTCAENAQHSLHNIQTLRGARTRDARNFARYLDETLERWGDDTEVHFGPHTWPVWGNEEVVEFLSSQRDTYKYIHDQALRMANKGYTAIEAAEILELPEGLGRKWYNRGYHGTVHHNVRAVFHKELGLWDGDPVTLHPLPPAESGRRYVDLIGADTILTEGRRAFEAGEYRWAVEILHKLVFAQPDNTEARELQADAYEQMGYQAEGPQWRGVFLTMARELREGVIEQTFSSVAGDIVLGMSVDLLFDYAAVRVVGDRAANCDLRIDFTFTDLDETWTMWVARGVLHARRGASDLAQLHLTGTKAALIATVLQPAHAGEALESGIVTAEGDRAVLATYASVLDELDKNFPIGVPERVGRAAAGGVGPSRHGVTIGNEASNTSSSSP